MLDTIVNVSEKGLNSIPIMIVFVILWIRPDGTLNVALPAYHEDSVTLAEIEALHNVREDDHQSFLPTFDKILCTNIISSL